jgi:hypothetical protein
MDKQNQKRIIKEICKGIEEKMIQNLNNVPEEWDGFELRQWTSDIVKYQINNQPLKGRRKKDYEHVIFSKNMV